MTYTDQVYQTVDFIKTRVDFTPEFGIILGTGLGRLVSDITVLQELDYGQIPHFPPATVESHKGKLIFGHLSGRKVVAMQGRFHYYEGYGMKEVTFPVRVLRQLGIQKLLVSNAAGGVNPDFQVSDLMVIEDHIDLTKENPLIGSHTDNLGDRFPDMSEPYERKMIDEALHIAKTHGIRCHEGVYTGISGPNLETRAEYRYIRRIGGDAVGMSTVPEVIVACQMNLPVFAISAITDLCDPDNLQKVEISRILRAAAQAEKGMIIIIRELIKKQ